MKKVFVVSKTHLDLGFTDYAKNVLEKYLTEYIPNAIKTANEVNTDGKKRFVWTTGSWLLLKALESENSELVRKALKDGNIAPHAMPFTIHTELLDQKSLDYALGMVDTLDEIIGTKTVAAKMTDVPGHTISLVPILAKHGIKLLHIGVNGASAMPNVPECFLWKHKDGSEVVIIYSGSYGGEFKCDLIDEILYFDHTVDNRGARNKEDTIKAFEKIEALYPEYEVEAGRMDDFANAIWEVRHKLPIITSEIGDTWIHGVGTDPYKVGAFKEAMKKRDALVDNGLLKTDSQDYKSLMECLLCVAEHTWGGDSKIFLSDYCHYDKEGFKKARDEDAPILTPQVLETEYGKDIVKKRESGEYNQGSYRAIERAWQEQREYVEKAIEIIKKYDKEWQISPLKATVFSANEDTGVRELTNGKAKICINENGSFDIFYDDKCVFDSKGRMPICYMAFCADDYDEWLNNYTRDFDDNHLWSLPDFCRPFLHDIDGKYQFGEYSPVLKEIRANEKTASIVYKTDEEHGEKLGCAREFEISLSFYNKNKIDINVKWKGKNASRVPEATFFRLYLQSTKSITATKCGCDVDISDIVENGSRRLFACEQIKTEGIKITNHHSPLCVPGFCNLVRFSNSYPSTNDGISFVLHDSIWGTNFPLWYEDDASFDFSIEIGE